MTIIDSKILVSHVVNTAINAISKQLSSRFNLLNGMPVLFYDWSVGWSDQFKQFFAKVPAEYREKAWYSLVYSYNNTYPSPIQSRPILENYIPIYSGNGITAAINAITRLTNVDIVCSVLTNDGNYANSISLNRSLSQSYWKNLSYYDVFYPQRKHNTDYPKSFIVIPKVPNNYAYISLNEGTTSNYIVNWLTTLDETVTDGTITWKCIEPRKAKLEISNFTQPAVKVPNVYQEGIKYSVDFAFTITFVGLEDADYKLETIKGFDNHIYSIVSNALT